MALLDFSTTNSQIADEVINVSDANPVNLTHDIIYNKTGKLVSIWTGAGSTGTELTDGVDYDIGDIFPDGSLPISISPDVAYTTVAITNVTYQSVDLYVSYYAIGDIISAARWNNVNPIPVVYDISSSNQTPTLPEITGYAQRFEFYWTGGDGSNTSTPTVTDGATVGGITAGTWLGEGDGHMIVVSDNSNWQVEVYQDYGTGWTKDVNGVMTQWGIAIGVYLSSAVIGVSAAFKTFISIPSFTICCKWGTATGGLTSSGYQLYGNASSSNVTTTTGAIRLGTLGNAAFTNPSGIDFDWISIGRWRT